MAVLKKIQFGTGSATPLAKTVLTAKEGGVMSVSAPINQVTGEAYTNGVDEDADYQYELDVNVDGTTIVKSTGSLAVGTVPAANVSVANGGHVDQTEDGKAFVGDDVEEVLLELNGKIAAVGGEAKSYKIVEVADPASTSLAEYKIQEQVGTGSWGDVTGSSTIVVPKDNAFVTAQLGHVGATADSSTGVITDGSGADALLIEYINGSGVYTLVAVPIGSFLTESEFKDGLSVSQNGEVSAKLGNGIEFGSESGENKSLNVKIDSTSESFLTVGANGVKLAGVQDAIDAKVAALDVTTDTAVAGQYVAAIEETDGVVAVKTRANVSDAVLTGYAKGNAPAAGSEAVAATDDVKGAIAKLEHQVDAAKSAASSAHSVVEHAQANTHVTVSGAANANGGMTYTVTESDIASAQGLANEITRAQNAETAIDTAVGLTKASGSETRSFTPTTNYGGSGASAATSVMDNMQKLDTALDALADTVGGMCYSISGTTLIFNGIPNCPAQSQEP